MPASDDGPVRAAVEQEVTELERLCTELEKSLVAGDWAGATDALKDSRRVTHAFINAMDAAADSRDEAFDAKVYARMRRVFDVRQDQLERLETFRGQVGERLQNISRFKEYARSVGAKRVPKRGAGLDRQT